MNTKGSITIKEKNISFTFGRIMDSDPSSIALDLYGEPMHEMTGLRLFKTLKCQNDDPDDFCNYFYEFDLNTSTVEIFGPENTNEKGYISWKKDSGKKIFSGSIAEFIEKGMGHKI